MSVERNVFDSKGFAAFSTIHNPYYYLYLFDFIRTVEAGEEHLCVSELNETTSLTS